MIGYNIEFYAYLAVVSMWGGDWYDFYIVEKDDATEPGPQETV